MRRDGWWDGAVPRLDAGDVGCWMVKTARPPDAVVPGWRPGEEREVTRCLRPSYRLELMRPGQPVLLWLSGRDRPGVHATGVLAGEVGRGADGPVVAVRFTLLPAPVPRADLLADPAARDAEVLRVPAGSNPSYLTPAQYAAVLAHLPSSHQLDEGTARPAGTMGVCRGSGSPQAPSSGC